MRILFIAMNNMGELTGGDTIWINLYKYWYAQISFVANEKAFDTLMGIYKPIKPTIKNILKNTIKQTYLGIKRLPKEEFDYVYSVSDFYPDLIPALIYKLKHPKTKWISGYYLVAPSIFSKNTPYRGFNRLKGILYSLMQIFSRFLVNKYADVVYITSEPDRKYFPKKKVVVIYGGITETGERNTVYKYQAIFIGRFHYQKGVLELLDIWKQVIYLFPHAKLCMIGNGPLMNEVLMKRYLLKLEKNIDIVGFKNGEEKYNFIKNSLMVLHPATYDSGGMACAEAMAFGLPAIGFDLPAYETYYPKGMVKVKTKEDFAHQITKFICNNGYEKYSKEAKELIMEKWIWKNRAEEIWNDTFI